jgi:hypothetical protein
MEANENQKKFGAQAYHDRVSKFLEDFLKNQVFPRHNREEIRAIVIYGAASAPGNTELGTIALTAVGTDEVKLMTEIEPSEVVAHGAAIWAQRTQRNPEKFMAQDGNRIVDDQYHAENEAMYNRWRGKHDEL